MKVSELMSSDAQSCHPQDSVAYAAKVMWDNDCGIVPVVDEAHKVVGMITDRDICIALASRNERATEVSVGEVANGNVIACGADDHINAALELMKDKQLRRLPIVADDGTLQGVLSVADLVTHSGRSTSVKSKTVAQKDVLEMLKALLKPRHA